MEKRQYVHQVRRDSIPHLASSPPSTNWKDFICLAIGLTRILGEAVFYDTITNISNKILPNVPNRTNVKIHTFLLIYGWFPCESVEYVEYGSAKFELYNVDGTIWVVISWNIPASACAINVDGIIVAGGSKPQLLNCLNPWWLMIFARPKETLSSSAWVRTRCKCQLHLNHDRPCWICSIWWLVHSILVEYKLLIAIGNWNT